MYTKNVFKVFSTFISLFLLWFFNFFLYLYIGDWTGIKWFHRKFKLLKIFWFSSCFCLLAVNHHGGTYGTGEVVICFRFRYSMSRPFFLRWDTNSRWEMKEKFLCQSDIVHILQKMNLSDSHVYFVLNSYRHKNRKI